MNWNDIPEDLPTPSLVVSFEVAQSNIQSMQAYCNEHQLRLCPHTKTHKSIRMAQEQISAGASGLTVAKVGEAEVMSQATSELFIAYPAIGTHRLQRVATLANSHRVRIGIDSAEAANMLQTAAASHSVRLGIMVDVDVGFHRTGVLHAQQAIDLCLHVSRQTNLDLMGLMCFPGHIHPASDDESWDRYAASLEEVIEGLKRKGIDLPYISGGSTPTARFSHRNKFLNEIRPGTYIYNDWNEVKLGVCTLEQCAARILATVVSVPEPNKFIVDAGSKTLSSDRNAANPDSGFGHVLEYPSAKIVRLSEEHGEIVLPPDSNSDIQMPKIGQRVSIIPNHICVCVNLQDAFYLMSDDGMILCPVDARGMLV